MPDIRPRLRVVFPPGAVRGNGFLRDLDDDQLVCLAECMEAQAARVGHERRALHEDRRRSIETDGEDKGARGA